MLAEMRRLLCPASFCGKATLQADKVGVCRVCMLCCSMLRQGLAAQVLQRQQLRALAADSAALACCTLSGAATRKVPVQQLAGGASQIAMYRSNVRGPGSGCHIKRRVPIASLSLALPC